MKKSFLLSLSSSSHVLIAVSTGPAIAAATARRMRKANRRRRRREKEAKRQLKNRKKKRKRKMNRILTISRSPFEKKKLVECGARKPPRRRFFPFCDDNEACCDGFRPAAAV